MARPPSTQPTDGELEILKVLWDSGPIGLGVLCAALRRGRAVATTTVATMLKIMLEKGLAKRSRAQRGRGQAGRGPGIWLWSAKVGRAATTSRMLKKLVDRVFDGSSQRLVLHLLGEGKLSDENRRQIRGLLEAGELPARDIKTSDRDKCSVRRALP